MLTFEHKFLAILSFSSIIASEPFYLIVSNIYIEQVAWHFLQII